MSMHILVVDDQAMIRQIHSKILIEAGHSLQTAENGIKALEMYRQFKENCPFDMVITDEEMPHMTGLELCEVLYKVEPGIPVIMVSSLEDVELMSKLMKMGITFFRKPIHSEDLCPYLDKVEEQVKIRKAHEQREAHHQVAEKFVVHKLLKMELNNDPNIHPAIMKYILDTCEDNGIREEVTFRIHFGLTETLINSVTHGNLEMSSTEFKKDGNFDLWDAEIKRRSQSLPYSERSVRVDVDIEIGKSVTVIIEDDGPGFDHQKILSNITPDDIYQAFGRGLVMLNNVADELAFNERGNRVTMKFLQSKD